GSMLATPVRRRAKRGLEVWWGLGVRANDPWPELARVARLHGRLPGQFMPGRPAGDRPAYTTLSIVKLFVRSLYGPGGRARCCTQHRAERDARGAGSPPEGRGSRAGRRAET